MPRGMIETLWTGSQPGQRLRDQRVAHLVVRDDLPLARIEQPVLLLQAGHDPLDGDVEVLHRDLLGAAARRDERRLVHEVREVRAGEAGRERRHLLELHAGRELHLARVDRQDLRAPARSGRSTSTCRSKRPARSSAGSRISGPVGRARAARCRPSGSKPSSSTSSWFSVCSFSSWPPPCPASTPRARPSASSSSMKMMAGAFCARLLEQVAHARRAHADEHLHELRAADGEERHARLAGDRLGEQRLAGAGRADEQDALRHPRAEPAVALRVLSGIRPPPSARPSPRRRPPRRRTSPWCRSRRRPWPCACRWP